MSKLLRRALSLFVVCVLTIAMLGAGSDDATHRFSRVGHNLMCVCGCGQVLLDCNHVGCPDSARMIAELTDQFAGPNGTGADSLILNWFVAKYGATVLAAPIRGGFDIVAWIIPLALFLLATIGTALVVKTWSRRGGGPPSAGGTPLPAGLGPGDAMRDRIRRETDFL